jgi:hypothetical protein
VAKAKKTNIPKQIFLNNLKKIQREEEEDEEVKFFKA